MVLIAYNEALEGELMELLDSNAVDGYTQWTQVRGKGVASEPHFLSHVWPKANGVVMCCVDDEKATKLMNAVRALRQRLAQEGVKAFSLPVSDVT